MKVKQVTGTNSIQLYSHKNTTTKYIKKKETYYIQQNHMEE